MRRYLVVAHQTLRSPELLDAMQQQLDQGPCVSHLVVPEYHGGSGLTWTEGQVRAEAARRLEEARVYFTEKGLAALREYAATPARVTPVKSDALLRLLIADLVGEAPTRASLDALREDVADLLARIAESEESARALPHRAKYLLIANGFLRGLLDLHLELADRVDAELAAVPEEGGQAAAT